MATLPRLVIFGCGYIGTAVAHAARARQVQVTALTRNSAKAALLRAEGIEVVLGDLAESAWHAAIPGGADYVLDCVSPGGGGPEAYRRSHVEGMASLLAWARARGAPGTLVYTSSTSVYPQGGGLRIDERAPATPAAETAARLVETETLLLGAAEARRRAFVLRLAGIYGPGRHHLIEQVRQGEASGRPETHLNLAYRDDIVAAIWACFGAPPECRDEIFNVADDGQATKGEIVAWLAARLGVPLPRYTGEPAHARRALTPDRIVANDKLKAALGWRPAHPTYREGLATVLAAGAERA